MLDLLKKNIHMNRQKGNVATQLTLDDDFIVPDTMDDVEQIILATGEVQVESSKNQGDRVIVRGNLAFQILYRREGGGLQTLAGRIPFEESINVPELDEKDYVQIFWNLEDLTAGIINSRKLNIRAVITLEVKVDALCLSLIHIYGTPVAPGAAGVFSETGDEEMEASERTKEIEKSIIKRFRKEIWKPFVHALNEYDMIKEGDNIAVCISGGKDSMVLAKCMQEILRHGKMQFGLKFLVMDPGYAPENRALIEENAKTLGIPIEIFESEIFKVVVDVEQSPCYLCARMRRGHLYAYARELGCNKIALGHHFDDVIETILMSMLYGAQVNTMMPKLHSTNFEGMELIRPLYLVKEADIVAWKDYNHLRFLQCACRFTEAISREEEAHMSKRQEMKELINKFRQINPHIETNIFKSVENVNLDACIGYVKNGERHHFLEEYEG